MIKDKRNKTIIIHSKVSYGYVGSNTTSLVLQMGGQDVITVPTVLYSNRLGLPTVGGGAISGALFSDILNGILRLNILNEVSSIITGFIGSAELVTMTADFVKEVKRGNPEIIYLCDPIMGDMYGGLYVPEEVPPVIMQHLLPQADLLTPNHFEMQRLVGQSFDSLEQALALLQNTFLHSNRKIAITGCHFSDTPDNMIDTIIIENSEVNVIRTNHVPVEPPGTGEMFAAHMHLLMLNGMSFVQASQKSSEMLTVVLTRMYNERRREFELTDIAYSMQIVNDAALSN